MIIILMNKSLRLYYLAVIFVSMGGFCQDRIPGSLDFKGKYTSDIKNSEIVIPQRVNKDGGFISHLVSHRHSKRSTKETDLIFYKIPIGGKDYQVELTPNRKLISQGAVLEYHKKPVGNLTGNFKNESLREGFDDLNIKKLENIECHFSGQVKGESSSKAALSTCYGLAGFIQINSGFYTIEPVAEHDPFVEDKFPHIIYKSDSFENSSVCQTIGDVIEQFAEQVRKRRNSNIRLSSPIYIETLIVLDKSFINHHQGTDCENYVLTVFNMAFNLFHDASLGLIITPTIVRIIRLEVENDGMNLKVNADAEKTLEYFQTWQNEINPGDDSHPNHHDVALLLTRVNVCRSPSSRGLLGLTVIGKACDPKLSAALCEDTGLRLGFVIAHEIGHLLGADHDPANLTSNGVDDSGPKTVMHPQVSLTAQTWSEYSKAYFKAFFLSGMGSCFLDEPEEHHFNIQDLLPGVMYDANFQCKHLLSTTARECDMGSTCDSLNCRIPGYACVVTHTPPADGTRCGENMWCRDSKCLVVGERPGAIDGNWGEWSPWSDCSRTCGSGVAYSVRQCDRPLPSHGGKNCVGERKKYKICAATPCETGRPSFRDIQCGEFDDWIYPEDGKVHTWKAHYLHDDNPCALYCINEEKQVAALKSRVVDGTMCYRGIRDICIGGTCKNVPCDLYFDSNAIEDACGVCHGDGTGCDFSEGMETLPKLPKGITKLVNVPSGTRNIKVEEMSPTLARIIVRDKDTKAIYVRGKTLGMFNVPGSQAWLGMIKRNQEALNIPGPVTKPLSIWIQRLENVTVKWSMALPAEQQRKPEFTWDFLKWGPCSAKCGPGTQKSEPSCMEGKAGLVEDTFCGDLEMPPTKVRPCEVAKCEPRWMVGDWKDCAEKQRKRVVFCIRPLGEGEGESEIISDTECPQPKPHDTETCERRRKREDFESSLDFISDGNSLNSDSDDFGFHKKYDDYLKHFSAVSTPQRKSETIPLQLVSSPHFKKYFRVLEVPENDESDVDSLSKITNTPNDQREASPEFYKNTFSGHQVDVSHFQTKLKDSIRPSYRGKNKLWAKRSDKSEKKGKKRLHRFNNPRKAKSSKSRSLFKDRKKMFNYTSRNLTHLVDKVSEGDDFMRSIYLRLIEKGKIEGLNPYERRKWSWNSYNQKTPILGNIKKSISNFLSPKEARKDLKLQSDGESLEVSPRQLSNRGFDGSGMKKALTGSLYKSKLKNYGRLDMLHEKKLSNPFNPINQPGADKLSYKGKHGAAIEKKKTLRRRQLRTRSKKKRSSYRWKKPKLKDSSSKTSKDTSSSADSKNYLNGLFRDTHQKPEPKQRFKAPVINTGQLVVDKDTIDNKFVEIVFLDDEDITQRTKRLPRPHHNEKRLTLRGRQAFDFLRRLRNERQAYITKSAPANDDSDKTEINIKIPTIDKSVKIRENSEETTESGANSRSTEGLTKTTIAASDGTTMVTPNVTTKGTANTTATTTATTATTAAKITTTPAPSTTTTTGAKNTTATPMKNTTKANTNNGAETTKKPETVPQVPIATSKTDAPQQSTTITGEVKTTLKQVAAESTDDGDCSEYDVDDNIPDSETTKEKKKEKKKKAKENTRLGLDDDVLECIC